MYDIYQSRNYKRRPEWQEKWGKKRQIKVAEYPRSGKEDRIYSLEASKYSLLPAGSAFMDFLPGVQPAGQTEIEK
jgi:hypothetical protein